MNYESYAYYYQCEDAEVQAAIRFQKAWRPVQVDDHYSALKERVHERITSALFQSKFHSMYLFEKKALEKWWGPQGIPHAYEALEPTVQLYYDRCKVYDPFTLRFPSRFRSHFLEELQPIHGLDLLRTYKGDHKSNGGLTGWCDRRTPGLAQKALYIAEIDPYHFDPQVLGQKFERNKLRTIYMDSFANQFRAASVWKPLADVMDAWPMYNWHGIPYMEERINNFLVRHPNAINVEGDAESMDTWISQRVFHKLSHELAKVVPHSGKWKSEFEEQESLWTTPLLTPKGFATGEHSLFSGLYPTHYIECMWMTACLDDLVEALPWTCYPSYGVHYVYFICGDDTIFLYDPKYCNGYVLSPAEVANHWRKWCMEANESKQRVAPVSEGVQFCKRMYFPNRRSMYPAALAINSFVHPRDGENLEPTGHNVVRFAQLMDNMGAHPCWEGMVRLMVKEFPWLLTADITPGDVAEFNSTTKSWRAREFGEQFSAQNSQTMRLMSKLG